MSRWEHGEGGIRTPVGPKDPNRFSRLRHTPGIAREIRALGAEGTAKGTNSHWPAVSRFLRVGEIRRRFGHAFAMSSGTAWVVLASVICAAPAWRSGIALTHEHRGDLRRDPGGIGEPARSVFDAHAIGVRCRARARSVHLAVGHGTLNLHSETCGDVLVD